MNVVSFISFLICLGILVISLRRNTDFLSPGRMFGISWFFVLGITNLKLSMLQREWSFDIWIQILLGPSAFFVGLFIMYAIHFDKYITHVKTLRQSFSSYRINESKLANIIVILFFLFIVSYAIISFKAGGIPVLSEKPWIVRREFTMFGIGLFLHNVFLMSLLTGVYFIFVNGMMVKKIILFSVTFISVILYSATLQRYQIILSIFVIIVLLYYTTNKINYKSVLITGILLIGFFYLISTFRLGELVLFILYKISKMKFSPQYAIFTEPYMYIAMNLENYAYSIEKLQSFSYGFFTFDFLTAITGLKDWIKEYYFLTEYPFMISINYNTYSAFWTYYRDFGIIGIFLIPLFGGLAIGNLFYSFKMKPTIKKMSLYGMLLYAVIFSFFNSAFGFLWFVYNFLSLILIFKYIVPKEYSEIKDVDLNI